MALIVLAVLLGTLAFVIALIARKRDWVIKLMVFPILILLWMIMASTPPHAESECERLFGPQVRQIAKQMHTVKPLGMDGFLLSFQIPRADFVRLIQPSFSMQPISRPSFLGRYSRPENWPQTLDNLTECLQRDVGEDDLRIYYDDNRETLYAVFHYWGW